MGRSPVVQTVTDTGKINLRMFPTRNTRIAEIGRSISSLTLMY